MNATPATNETVPTVTTLELRVVRQLAECKRPEVGLEVGEVCRNAGRQGAVATLERRGVVAVGGGMVKLTTLGQLVYSANTPPDAPADKAPPAVARVTEDLQLYSRDARRQVAVTACRLADALQNLSDKLARSAKVARAIGDGCFGEMYRIASRGEVGEDGRDIDRLCALLAEKDNARKMFDGLLQDILDAK